MKTNVIGIVGGIIAFVSLVLPWWTVSASAMGMTISSDISLYQVGTVSGMSLEAWYAWIALAFIIIGGLLGIVGGVTAMGKKLLMGGGVLALLSIIIFAVGLQMNLSNLPIPGLGLFSSFSYMGANLSTYLSYGFWLALVAAILMFVASRKKPAVVAAAPPPPPPSAVY